VNAPSLQSEPVVKQGKVSVLLLEDNDGDARLLQEILGEEPNEFVIERAERLSDALARLEKGGVDLMLSDLSVADSKGIATFTKIHERHSSVPVIVMSGLEDQELATQTVEKGAQDYLVKGHVDHYLLVRAMRYALKRAEAERLLAKERDLLHTLLDNIPDRIYFKDEKSRFLRVSQSMLGKHHFSTPEEMIGKTDFDLFTLEHAQSAFDDEQQVMRTGRPIVDKVEKETWSDGSVTWSLTTKLPLRDKRGNIVGTFGLSRDITELKKMETALAGERNLLRTLIDTLPDSISVKDAGGRYLMDNAAHLQLVGKTDSSEVVGRTVHDLYSREAALKFQQDDLRLIETGKPIIDKEEPFIDANGRERWLQTTKMPIFDASGKVTSFVCASRDITERKRSREQLAHYTAQLREKNEEMEEDLHMAREIQDAFIPQHYPSFPSDVPAEQSALRFYHKYQPTTEVGGDFFHVLRLSDTMAAVFICDVMGHGVRAALITAIQRALVEELADVARDPVRFLEQMNHALVSILRRARNSMFASAFYMVVDVSTGLLRYVNAGHPRPLLVRRDAGVVETLSQGEKAGPVLGIFDNPAYAVCEARLAAHDMVILFTDGVLEVEGANGDFYDSVRLASAVRRHIGLPAKELLEEIFADVRRFSGGKDFIDDICVIGVDVQRLCPPA
jgi:PAS domain S-box-containing protein